MRNIFTTARFAEYGYTLEITPPVEGARLVDWRIDGYHLVLRWEAPA